MNEIIKELAEQSEITQYIAANDKYLERFAELVVLKCISVVDNTPPGYRDYRDQIEKGMRDACSQAIRDTFGVEE